MDQEFDTVSGFLLKRTKDMVNKYRQLLVREAQVRLSVSARAFLKYHQKNNISIYWYYWFPQQGSPSAEMVMLERLFLQAERCALVEDRRRVRKDPGQCHHKDDFHG